MLNTAQSGEQLKMLMSANEIREQHRIHWPDLVDMVSRGKVTPQYGNPKAEDLWRGKLEEAEEPHNMGGGRWESHADAIRRGEGGIDKPLHLARASVAADMKIHRDRPGIVGGHHRLAVMLQHDPDKLLPVVHHESIMEAKYGSPDAPTTGKGGPRRGDYLFS